MSLGMTESRWGAPRDFREEGGDPSAAKQAIRGRASATCLCCDKYKVDEDCCVLIITIKTVYERCCLLFTSAFCVCVRLSEEF